MDMKIPFLSKLLKIKEKQLKNEMAILAELRIITKILSKRKK